MILSDIVASYKERGGGITYEKIYNEYGQYPAYSASTTKVMGYCDDYNYELTPYSIIYTLNGDAGSVLLSNKHKKIWLSSDTGVLEIEPGILDGYKKETIAVYLNHLFRSNRHNNGGRPKFTIKRCLDLELDEEVLEFIERQEIADIEEDNAMYEVAQDIAKKLNMLSKEEEETIELIDLIDNYKERGERLTHGKDLYPNYGKYPVYSANIYGPMGHYYDFNYELQDNSILYTIDGKNAGSVLTPSATEIWLTDHAGVISIKDEYIEAYGKYAIAIYLDYFFKNNLDVTGARPQFLLKKTLRRKVNLTEIEVLKEVKNCIDIA